MSGGLPIMTCEKMSLALVGRAEEVVPRRRLALIASALKSVGSLTEINGAINATTTMVRTSSETETRLRCPEEQHHPARQPDTATCLGAPAERGRAAGSATVG